MWTRLRIEDFQSLAEVDLELGRLNVLVGPTGRGKSAIVRALESMCFNPALPKDGSYVRRGQKECLVLVEDEDGTIVSWVKGPQPLYVLIDEEGDHEFTKLGRGVPDEIVDALGVRDIPIDGQYDIRPQMHTQGLDYGWLLRESPARRARTLAAMTKLDAVVQAQQLARREVRQHADLLKSTTALRDAAESDLAAYEDLPAEEKRLRKAQALAKTIEAAMTRLEKGEALLKRRQRQEAVGQVIEPPRSVKAMTKDVERLLAAASLVERRERTMNNVELYEVQAAEISAALKVAESTLATLRKQIDVCEVCGRGRECDKCRSKR